MQYVLQIPKMFITSTKYSVQQGVLGTTSSTTVCYFRYITSVYESTYIGLVVNKVG